MIFSSEILSQNSFGFTGYWGLPENISTPLYSYEGNPSSFSNLKDWGISLTYGSEISGEINSNLYSISLSKKLASHNLSGRFSPGHQKEFLFRSGETIIINDTTTQSLEARFTYKELFGLGYSYKFNPQLSAGFSFRFFNQDFNQEIVKPVFGDTLFLVRENLNEKVNFWKADLGLSYKLNDEFSFAVSSLNLLNFGDDVVNEEFQGFELRTERGALIAASFNPADVISFNAIYETSNSFQFNTTGKYGSFIYGVTAMHDKYQLPFITGIIPSLGYKTKLFEVILSGVKYFSDRNTQHSFAEFNDEGIHNIINNKYSFDKILLSVSFNIDATREQRVKLIDVELADNIYPAFTDLYLDKPIAYGIVVNLTDENLAVKLSVKIEGVNDNSIFSPETNIQARDTLKIPYYTIIPDNYSSSKAILSYADFYVSTISEEPDDNLQKAILINGINAWDGKVGNLKYFIYHDLNFAMSYSKNILSENKQLLDTLPSALTNFYKAKLLFDDFVQKIVYSSDPRATEEYVQYPQQTIELKGGDCDDLSVCYSALLESVGIETALIDYKSNGTLRHVQVMFNTKLLPNQARYITGNDTKYFLRKNQNGKDEVWLPIETTSLTDFEMAWNLGVEKFNKQAISDHGIAKGKVEIIEVY